MNTMRHPRDPSATAITDKPYTPGPTDSASQDTAPRPARRSRAQKEAMRRTLARESQKVTVLRPIRKEVVGSTPVSRDTRLDPVLMNRPSGCSHRERRLREKAMREKALCASARGSRRGPAFLVVLLASATSFSLAATGIAFAGVCALCLLT